MQKIVAVVGIVAVLLIEAASGIWKPEYASQPQEVRDWYKNAELTEAAKKRFQFQKCCDHADVVRTKFKVSHDNGADQWWWLNGETWERVPDDIIHWGEHAPDGQPTLFVYTGMPTCFFPADGGI